MLNDLFRSGAAWRCLPLQQSPFRHELEEQHGTVVVDRQIADLVNER